MEIKIFIGYDVDCLEKDVNDFIKEKEIIDIKYSHTSFIRKTEYRHAIKTNTEYSCMIIYKNQK